MAAENAADAVVTVRYFAAAAEAAGCEEEQLTIADDATLGVLKADLVERYGELMGLVVKSGSFLMDGVVQRDETYPVGERVDVLPPFAGG